MTSHLKLHALPTWACARSLRKCFNPLLVSESAGGKWGTCYCQSGNPAGHLLLSPAIWWWRSVMQHTLVIAWTPCPCNHHFHSGEDQQQGLSRASLVHKTRAPPSTSVTHSAALPPAGVSMRGNYGVISSQLLQIDFNTNKAFCALRYFFLLL